MLPYFPATHFRPRLNTSLLTMSTRKDGILSKSKWLKINIVSFFGEFDWNLIWKFTFCTPKVAHNNNSFSTFTFDIQKPVDHLQSIIEWWFLFSLCVQVRQSVSDSCHWIIFQRHDQFGFICKSYNWSLDSIFDIEIINEINDPFFRSSKIKF